jgi:hypothetical protein
MASFRRFCADEQRLRNVRFHEEDVAECGGTGLKGGLLPEGTELVICPSAGLPVQPSFPAGMKRRFSLRRS